jgi:peroxiredoxin Q/BCP
VLAEGDKLPKLTLLDDEGQKVSTYDLLGRGSLVLWFYPKDDTPG